MTMLHALVVDDDRTMLGFIAEALATFEPGFRVSTATSLDGATRRLAVQRPDIVLVRSSAVPPGEWDTWVRTHDIDPDRIGVVGAAHESHLGCAGHCRAGVAPGTPRSRTRPREWGT